MSNYETFKLLLRENITAITTAQMKAIIPDVEVFAFMTLMVLSQAGLQ